MRIHTVFAGLLAASLLGACGDDPSCTEAEAQSKLSALLAKVQEVGASNPEKLQSLLPQAQELATQAQKGNQDLGAACKSIDSMMAELKK